MTDQLKKLNLEVTKDFFTNPNYDTTLYFNNHPKEMNTVPTYTAKLGDLNSFKTSISHLHRDKLARLDHFLTEKLDQFPLEFDMLKCGVSKEAIECILVEQRCFQDFKDALQAEIDSRNTVESVPRNVFDDVSAFLDELNR